MAKVVLKHSRNRPSEETALPVINPSCCKDCTETVLRILIYFALSVGLVFYQRRMLQEFHFPWSVVTSHLVIKFLLAGICRTVWECYTGYSRTTLMWDNYVKKVAPTGVASGFDVGFSNWGLELVTVSLYTMTKSTAIVFILGFALLFKLEKKSWSLMLIVAMISGGLFLFTYKATQFDALGFILVLVASFTSGMRWTLAQLVMQKSKVGLENPLDMVYHVQPWMILAVLPFAVALEGTSIAASCKAFRSTDGKALAQLALWVTGGALLAFSMEVAEYMVVAHTSSLTLSLAGIFKEVFTLVLAVEWTGDQMSGINFVGLLLCLGGITCHVSAKMVAARKPNNVMESSSDYDNQPLLAIGATYLAADSDSSGEESDSSQVLFDIIQRRDNIS